MQPPLRHIDVTIHRGEIAMSVPYEVDLVAWATEQATLLRQGKWSALDIEHIAEEIEDVGRSVRRELRSRMAVLLAHLLKWQWQPRHRGKSWVRTIRNQREELADLLNSNPSLLPELRSEKWQRQVWENAVTIASKETGLDEFPEHCPWTFQEAADSDFFPDA